eukprot:m51a1_g6151 hypothetical protein (507) ;mRNA; r:302521-304321
MHSVLSLSDLQELFKQQYHRTYATKAEGTAAVATAPRSSTPALAEDRRRAIFHEKIRKIEAIQAEQPTATRTHLTSVGLESVVSAVAAGRGGANHSQGELFGSGRDSRSIPASYYSPYVSRIARHQRDCGSCWAFGTAEMVEAAWNKAQGVGTAVALSPQQLLDCTVGSCQGGSVYDALEYIKRRSGSMGGLMAERDYPYAEKVRPQCGYQAYKAAASITRWGATLAEEPRVMPMALVTFGALLAAMNGDTLETFNGGVMEPTKACKGKPNHVVLIVGYDSESFFRLRRGVNACNIAKAGGLWAEAATCKPSEGGACAYPFEVGNDGQWGTWGNLDSCPGGRFARGFVTKSEANQGGKKNQDDTALNGVRLVCESSSIQKGPTSLVGPWGTWDEPVLCPKWYYVSAVQVREEKFCGEKCDDTALNAIRVRCRSMRTGVDVQLDESHSKTSWGVWSQWYDCPVGTAVTGIRTRVEPPQDKGDDTALNAVRLHCTPFPSKGDATNSTM